MSVARQIVEILLDRPVSEAAWRDWFQNRPDRYAEQARKAVQGISNRIFNLVSDYPLRDAVRMIYIKAGLDRMERRCSAAGRERFRQTAEDLIKEQLQGHTWMESLVDEGRWRDFLSPRPPEHYEEEARQAVAAIDPWIFNRASRYPLNDAVAEVIYQAGLGDLQRKFSKLGGQVFMANAVKFIEQELKTWQS